MPTRPHPPSLLPPAALACLLLCALPPCLLCADPSRTPDLARALAHTRHLCAAIGPRPAGSPAEARAVGYVASQLTAMGYAPQKQAVKLWDGRTSANVSATLPGSERLVILGAHLDTVPGSPGANDNAAGVGVLLELARYLKQQPPGVTVRFVAFCSEETQYRNRRLAQPCATGARVYVRSLDAATRSRLAVMVNLDMVGAGTPLLNVGDMSEEGQPPARRCLQLARGLGVRCTHTRAGGKSDYRPFADAGLPVVQLDWGDHPSRHTAEDTYEVIEPGKLKQTLEVVAAYVGDC